MPVITTIPRQSGAPDAPPQSPPQINEINSPVIKNIQAINVSAISLTHDQQPASESIKTKKSESECFGDIPDEETSRLLSVELYEQAQREKKRNSCRPGLLIAGMALIAATGAFAWRILQPGANTQAKSDIALMPGSGKYASDINFSMMHEAAALPLRANRERTHRNHKKALRNKPCYLYQSGKKISVEIPCKKGKKGKGNKRWADIDTLPQCKRKKVLNRCKRKYTRANNPLNKRVINKRGKRCVCPPLTDLTANQHIPQLKRDNIYKYVDDKSSQRKITTTEPGTTVDEVVTRQMYNLDCAKERENLSWAQIFRKFGKSMSGPVGEAYKEGKIAYDYIIKESGCPSPESLEKAEKITGVIDYLVSSVLSLVPGTKLLTIGQNIIGPMFEMIADSMEGKEPDFNKIIAIDQQIMAMMRPAIPTMSRSEQTALYGKVAKGVEVPKTNNKILTKRYIYRDNLIYVKVEGKEYLFHKGLDNRPFVEHNRFINFNHIHNAWEFAESTEVDVFSSGNIKNRDYYGISLEKLPDNSWINFNEYEFVTIYSAGNKNMKGVFLGGEFIAADWDHVDGVFVAFTHDGNYLEQRVITFSDYGWVFEQPSVKMDKNLQLFLESYENGIDYYPENRISAIDKETSLCHSNQNIDFIKKDYKYYEVKKVRGESDTYALSNDPSTIIKWDKGLFKLEYADNMIFGLRSDLIPGALNEKDAFYVEKSALEYLLGQAVPTQSTPVRAIRPGLYMDKANKPIFIINDNNFVVNKHSDRYIYLKRDPASPGDDIAFWSDQDTWLRVREGDRQPIDYQEVATCRTARSPGKGSGCLPVVIESELHLQLQKHIDRETTSNNYPVPGSLTQMKLYDMAVVFHDATNKRNYFLYGGKYFDAQLIDTFDDNNPTGFPIIKATGRGSYFNREKFIANIILEEKKGRLEIKNVDTFIAEKLNVNKDIAHAYNKNRQYRYLPEISAVDDLVSEAGASGTTFVEFHPPESAAGGQKAALITQYDTVKQELFPHRIVESSEHEIEFIKLGAQSDPRDPSLQAGQQYVQEKVRYIKQQLIPWAKNSLYYGEYYWADTGLYLSHLLDSSDIRFLTNIAEAMRQTMQRVDNALNAENIYLVRAVNKYAKASQAVDVNPYQTQRERFSGKSVTMSDKDDNRLFINIDKLNFTENDQRKDVNDLIGIIIEELFSKKGKTADIFTMEKTNGVYPAAKDVIEKMIESIETKKLTPQQMINLKEVSRVYLQNVPQYKPQIPNIISPEKLAWLARNDNGYLAHLLLHSPACLTVILEDIYCQLAQSQLDSSTLDPWVTNFVQQRELNIARKEISITTKALELNRLTKTNVHDMDFGNVKGMPGVYYTEPGLDLLYQSGEDYYPLEFVGKSNRVVFIGPRDQPRHVYYYNPENGDLSSLQQISPRQSELTYNRQLNLYQSINRETGEAKVLKYDERTERLVATGAQKIVSLPNNVLKVEHQGFDILYPEDAGAEVFIAAHGSRQINLSNTPVPENVKVFFYTKKWQSLHGHVDDLIDLVKGKIASTESKESWQKLESYDMTLDQESQINYAALAQESRKSLIRIKPKAQVSSKEVIAAVSKMFSDKQIEIHLYICRSI